MIKIKGFIETSFLDWDGKISSVIFLPGCNLRCIYCHNYKLVISSDELPSFNIKTIIDYLTSHRNWIDGVCITGGEPCINKHIDTFIKKIKNENFSVKLDTNGFFPEVLEKLVKNKLIDYVALDIKAPLAKSDYTKITGVLNLDINKLLESIKILRQSTLEYEFRTTVIPSFIDEKEVESIAKCLIKNEKFVLQNFKPDNSFDKKLHNIKPYDEKKMLTLRNIGEKFIKNCIIRG